jgi:hypothetical protein
MAVAEASPYTSTVARYAMLSTVLLIVVILLLVGAFPAWPYSRSWGYAPTGTLGVVLIVVIVLVLMGTI